MDLGMDGNINIQIDFQKVGWDHVWDLVKAVRNHQVSYLAEELSVSL